MFESKKKTLAGKIKDLAIELGFDKVGISSPDLAESTESDLREWLGLGFEGSMRYMTRDGLKRARPREIMPEAKSVISLALNYYYPDGARPAGEGPFGKISRYARGRDYHGVIQKKLKELVRGIRRTTHEGVRVKAYVDTGPIMEKAFAQQAGIGFYGKNTNILTRELGSWIFLASLITDLELDFDAPHAGSCGSCRLCVEACPTGALVSAYRIDARKCLAYWTIESRDEIPQEIISKMGDHVFGCDICQDVCPYNRRPKISRERAFDSRSGKGTWLDLSQTVVSGTADRFMKEYEGTALKRSKPEGLIRNAKAVWKNVVAVDSLKK